MLEELSKLLEFKIERATVEHAQTIRTLEIFHGPLKRCLGNYENQFLRDWHKYVDFAVFQHNISYNSTIFFPQTPIFHGQIPQNPLDLRFGNKNINHQQYQYENILPISKAKWRHYSVKPKNT